VQHFEEGFSRGPEVKALSRGVVVDRDEGVETPRGEFAEVGLSRDQTAHPADRVLDAALLPGCVRIAEVGLDGEPMQSAVAGKLGAIVEGDGPAQRGRQRCEQADQMPCDRIGGLVGTPDGKHEPGGAFMHREDGLTILGE